MMKVVSKRLVFGDATTSPDDTNIDVQLKPSTAASALGLWVLAGVLTHVAIRFVDRWMDGK